MRWAGHAASIAEFINAYRIFIRNPEEKESFRRPTGIREDNNKMYLGEIEFQDVNWIHLDPYKDQWRALLNMAMRSYAL